MCILYSPPVDSQDPPFATQVLASGPAAIAEAARLIGEGWPVAVPTETVYGLAADATDPEAVARIYRAKGRPAFNPLIVPVRDLAEAELHGELGEAARAVALAWWPGPLTLVVPLRQESGLAPAVTAGLPTVALRCPAHPAMRSLLEACGRPLAAPSANLSGGISPTRADHVLRTLDGRIPLILDGGPTEAGIESTIVGFADGAIRLLRPGPVDFAEIAMLARLADSPSREGRIEAPGQLASHYAPSKPLRLDAISAEPDEWLIGFGAVKGHHTLSATGDLAEAAARLFAALHLADMQAPPRIAVAPVPAEGIGAAINDRLRRAAAARLMPLAVQAGLWGLLSGSALLIGALIGWFLSLSRRTVAGVMAFGAGVLISALSFELMDEAWAAGGFWPVAGGFLGGAAIYTVCNRLLAAWGGKHRKRSEKHVRASDRERNPDNGSALALGALLDGVPESIVIGVSLLEGKGVAMVAVAAVFLSNLPEGLSSAAGMKSEGKRAASVFLLWGAISLSAGIAAVAGYLLFDGVGPAAVAAVQAVAAGAILAMIVDTMVPEAFEGTHDFAGLIAVAGFLLAFALSKLEG